MNRVIKILMERDDMTESEARELLAEVRSELEIAAAEEDYELAEDIMYGDLGLEMDYLFDVLGF